MRADLEAILPEQFTFTEDRDYADYIYLRSDSSTLKGKKFQAKRNHINRFRNTYPDYEYTPITLTVFRNVWIWKQSGVK